MKTINGDLVQLALAGEFDVIIHGCNCLCTMGSGIAKTIREYFPKAYEIDQETIKGDKNKLGKYSCIKIERNDLKYLHIVNAYTQYKYANRNIQNADYDAIRSVMKKIKEDFTGLRIGYPKIGAGLAGGDWNIISKIIDEELDGENHTLVIFNKI